MDKFMNNDCHEKTKSIRLPYNLKPNQDKYLKPACLDLQPQKQRHNHGQSWQGAPGCTYLGFSPKELMRQNKQAQQKTKASGSKKQKNFRSNTFCFEKRNNGYIMQSHAKYQSTSQMKFSHVPFVPWKVIS